MKKDDDRLKALRVYRRVGTVLPKSVTEFFEKKLRCAGIREDARVWLGMRLLLSFFTGSILMLLYLIIYDPIATLETSAISLLLIIGGFVGLAIPIYFNLYFRIADRAAAMEKVLPDFLMLTVSNLRAGMSPFAAFAQAARPEFGALYEEVMLATAKTGGTASLSVVLAEMGNYFDSDIFRRTVALFAKGMRSGGQLTKLLSASAEEVRKIQDLRAELTTTTRTYKIFLGFIVIIVMPFLLSVSIQFITIFLDLQFETGDTAQLGMDLPTFTGTILINPEQMVIISIATLALTNLLVSALIGIISKGKALYGMKYFPLYCIASVLVFFIAKTVVGNLLVGFGGGM